MGYGAFDDNEIIYENSTALGYNAEPDASNQIMLGDTNVTQIKSTANLYLTGSGDNYLAGNLGIGTDSPNAELHVVGDLITVVDAFDVGSLLVSGNISAGDISTPNIQTNYIGSIDTEAKIEFDTSGNVVITIP